MPAQRLSAAFVENAPVPEQGRAEYWDTHSRGLGLRVTENAAKSWVVMYRVDGRQRRLTLGRYPAVSLADARAGALEALGAIAQGRDPADERQAARQAAAERPLTVVQVADRYIEERVRPRNRTWQETKRYLDRFVLPAWGTRGIEDITRRDVIALVNEIARSGTPILANRALAAISACMSWCVGEGLIEASPAVGAPKPGRERARDRVLTDAEIQSVWAACTEMGAPFGLAFQFLLVTGQRREEVGSMQWAELDWDNALWTIPAERNKSGRLHEVPLSPLALELLGQAPNLGAYVFTTLGDRPISGFSKAKKRCDVLSEVTDWRIHDLRRTSASGMARLRVPPHVIEKVLNHSSGTVSGVAAVYNRHGYLDEKRQALEVWSTTIADLIDEEG